LNSSSKQTSAFGSRLGGLLADLTKPTLEGGGVAGSFCRKDSRDLAQRFDLLLANSALSPS
jgi:hypothetical protein